MIIELLGHEDYIRILLAIQREGGLRFGQLETLLELNPARVDRALKFLRRGRWIDTRPLSSKMGRGQLEYRLGKRGAAFLEAFAAFNAAIARRKKELGSAEVVEFEGLYRQGDRAAGGLNTGRVARVIKIGPLRQDEKETPAAYLRSCLRLSPQERIAEMRALSRRIISLNPRNPKSPHIDRKHIRITHDTL